MLVRLFVPLVLAGTLALAAPATAAPCYDLAAGQPHVLTGRLDYVVYTGPPNFEDVQKGDTPEPNFVLRLAQPICLRGDEFADPNTHFSNVQVVETRAVSGQLRHLLNRQATLRLTQQMAAETGHHHEPLVAWVTAASLASAPPRLMAFTDEYGTAATTIRAFYASLGDGQGGPASEMIVPEKRGLPDFSPDGLSRFYGSLSRPITLIDIAYSSSATYVAHYRYATAIRRGAAARWRGHRVLSPRRLRLCSDRAPFQVSAPCGVTIPAARAGARQPPAKVSHAGVRRGS